MAKNLHALAGRRDVVTHVLHDAEDGHVHLLEHRNAFPHDAQRRLLRRGDDDAAIERDDLAEGKLRVASAGRKVHEQIIQVAPRHAGDELLNRLLNHRPAPDDGLIVVQKKADAHQLHAVADGRNHFFIHADFRAALHAHHQRNARAVDVAIEQADFRAEMRERAGEVHRGGGFAHAALAAGHGDDALDAGHLGLVLPRAGGGGLLRRGLADFHKNVIDAGQRAQDRLAVGADLLGGVHIGGGHLHHDGDGAVADGDVLDQAERNDVARIAGILDGFQGFLDCLFVNHEG